MIPRLGRRSSGVLLHPTSLPGPHGNGDLGPEAYRFADFLARSWDLIRLAWMSAPHTAIAPVQDLLGLGSQARMNRPGTSRGNWAWRQSAGSLDEHLAQRLAELTLTYGRGRPTRH